jgi:hypothetical protein
MGLKGAGSYFQRQMAMTILVGLVSIVCELYLDNVLVYGETETEFLKNLRTVFARFRKHNVLLKPKKCAFGMSKIEFVGHTISKEGVSFSREKLQEVLDFPRPVTQQQLRQFIGLANYYRDHVRNHSDKARPLIQMFKDYDKRKKIVWTPEAIEAYEILQRDVSECHTLFFVDENAPIFLCTDASDYGIGGYLYQVIDGKE